MPSIGLHLSSNVYICPKGNTLARYSPKLCTDALRYPLALTSPRSLVLATPSELSQPPSTEPAPPPPRWCYHQ